MASWWDNFKDWMVSSGPWSSNWWSAKLQEGLTGNNPADPLGGSGSSIFSAGSDFFKTLGEWISGRGSAQQQFENNLALQHDQQAYNSAEAEKDRQFQAEQSSTQYQRGVADLRAAGLNPWLAVQGSNASAASGSTASSSAGSVSQTKSGADQLQSLASTAVSAALIAKIVAKIVA